MLSDTVYTLEDIQKSSDHLREKRPYIKELISFYEALFTIQAQYAAVVKAILPDLDKKTVNEKIEHGFPLVSKQDFTFDSEISSSVFEKVLELCLNADADIKNSARFLSDFMHKKEINFNTLARKYLTDELSETLPENENQHLENIAFIIYNALKPSVVNFSKKLAETCVQKNGDKENSVCPVCGEQPAFSVLSADGHRSLVCSFCWHEWPVIRIFCPFCRNKENDSLSYLYIEGEKQIRADLCDKCLKYIKSVDLRELANDLYPPLEIVTSVSIDMKASEKQ